MNLKMFSSMKTTEDVFKFKESTTEKLEKYINQKKTKHERIMVGNRWFRQVVINATMFVMCSCFITFMIVSVMSFLSSKSITFYDSRSGQDTITLVDTIYVQSPDTTVAMDTIVKNMEIDGNNVVND